MPALVIMLDDAAFGVETSITRQAGIDPRADNPDFAEAIRILGLDAHDVESAEELRAVLPEVVPLRRPTVVRLGIDDPVRHEEIFRGRTG